MRGQALGSLRPPKWMNFQRKNTKSCTERCSNDGNDLNFGKKRLGGGNKRTSLPENLAFTSSSRQASSFRQQHCRRHKLFQTFSQHKLGSPGHQHQLTVKLSEMAYKYQYNPAATDNVNLHDNSRGRTAGSLTYRSSRSVFT